MSYQYSDYPSQARRLADAGASLLEAIADPAMDRGLIMVELEAAARGTSARDLRLRFQPAAATPVSAPPSPEDVLSGILLELQSANALMAAGLAMNEHGRGAQSQFLNDTVSEVRSTSLELGPHIARLQFAPQVEPSTTLEKALKLFRNSADRALESISGGTESVISSCFDKLKEVDQSKVSQAIENLGKSFQILSAAGRLIRQGLEKLKGVLEALSNLCGPQAFADMKNNVHEIWRNFSADKTLVRRIIGEPAARRRVSDFAALQGLEVSGLDGMSRALALLEDKYQGKRKILNALRGAVVLAMGMLGALQMFGLWAAAPWVALAAGGAYAAIIGGALLVGVNYTGSRPLFGWIRGVCEIVQDPRLAKAVQ